MSKILEDIINEFKKLDCIKAVVLAGSTQNVIYDDASDYDIYVYSTESIPVKIRQELALKYSATYEINNQYWENGDEWEVENHSNIGIMYRDYEMPQSNIDWVLKGCNASVGFTTCILYNIQKSKILFDKDNWFENLQSQVNEEYPNELQQAIIDKNFPILNKNISSYRAQIEKAILRNDFVNLNNRISAFLNSYFDILFALNKVYHPGEKRLIELAIAHCEKHPENFEENIKNLLSDISIENLDKVYYGLEKLLLINNTI